MLYIFAETDYQKLLRAQGRLVYNGISSSSRRTHRSQLNRYKMFCIRHDFRPFPCTTTQACLYATYLSVLVSPVSVRNYLSCVWYYNKLKGHHDGSSDFIVKQTLNGIDRLCTKGPSMERYPLTPADLLRMYSLLDMTNNYDIVFWIAVLICYRGLLRKSHLTPSPHTIIKRNYLLPLPT